jgi:hypothetical protein
MGSIGSCVKDTDERASSPIQHARTPVKHAGKRPEKEESHYEQGLYINHFPDLVDEHDSLCKRCTGMDIDTNTRLQLRASIYGVDIMELGTNETLATSPCPLCRLLATISPWKSKLARTILVHLRAFSACVEFSGGGLSLGSTRSLKDSVLLSIVSVPKDEVENDGYRPCPVGQKMLASVRETGTLLIQWSHSSQQKSGTFSIRFIEPHGFSIHLGRCWLDFCRNNHINVYDSTKLSRPQSLRLIDCKSRKIIEPTSPETFVNKSDSYSMLNLGTNV